MQVVVLQIIEGSENEIMACVKRQFCVKVALGQPPYGMSYRRLTLVFYFMNRQTFDLIVCNLKQ